MANKLTAEQKEAKAKARYERTLAEWQKTEKADDEKRTASNSMKDLADSLKK